jgi:hypothetical protein
MREGEYRQGAEQGLWTSFYRGGVKQQEVRYVDGRPEGSVRRWHPNGRLMLEGNYEAGARAGTWRRWFTSGARYEERTYADGMRDGRFLRWDGQGRLALVLACAKDRCWQRCQATPGAACSLDEAPSASGAKATPEPAAARRPPRTRAP